MVTATITLHKLIQDSQEYGSDDEHMVSRVFFDLILNGKRFDGLHTNIKQTVGSSFESSALEISGPHNYGGPFNYEAFRSIVEKYYRDLVGAGGSGIRISGGSNIRMRNNLFTHPVTAEFQVTNAGGPW